MAKVQDALRVPESSKGRKAAPGLAADDDLASSPLWVALAREPALRDDAAVRTALDWWIQHLLVGAELAPELRAPGDGLVEAFRRGRLVMGQRGQRIQEEGEEVRHYTIILLGCLRLSCHIPAPKNNAPKAPKDDNQGNFVCEEIQRGESPGLIPGESRSPFQATCADRCVVLQLSAEDYAAALRSHHQDIQANVVDFLQSWNVFPNATAQQLSRLASSLRHRCCKRGAVIAQAGEGQRHIWILKEGSCTVLAPPGAETVAVPVAEDAEANDLVESDSDSETERKKQQLQAAAACGADKMYAAVVKEENNAAVSKYACGRLLRTLQGNIRRPQVSLAQSNLGTPISRLTEPGAMLGEEVLLFEGFREQLAARCTCTVRVDTDSVFYTLDATCYRVLLSCIATEVLLDKVATRVMRQSQQLEKTQQVAKQMNKQKRSLQQRELIRAERQEIRLPPCAGAGSTMELDDLNDWLGAVLEYRRPPKNTRDPPTLVCLDNLGLNFTNVHGPGIDAMVKLFGDKAMLRQHREMLKRSGYGSRRRARSSSNPMGDTIDLEASARYAEAVPHTIQPAMPEPYQGGSFFATEPDFEDMQPFSQISRASSVPVLPRLEEERLKSFSLLSTAATPAPMTRTLSGVLESKTEKTSKSDESKIRNQKLTKAFHRAVQGKSLLILTDKADVKKSILRALLSAAAETSLCFVKTTSELWTRLRDAKEHHHAILLDLSKSELQVDSLITVVRNHDRYGKIPIIVLAFERELPSIVRESCSFVVFYPLAAAMLREALLWCFDRKAIAPAKEVDSTGP